jgi:hypothetical protein
MTIPVGRRLRLVHAHPDDEALLCRGEFTSRADLIEKITGFAIRYNRIARPWRRAYDARVGHARYRARHRGRSGSCPRPAARPGRP